MKILTLALVAMLLPLGAAAQQPWEPGQLLDTCIEAGLKQRPGMLRGWRQARAGDMPLYAVSILNEEGLTEEATCDPRNPDQPLEWKRLGGLLRYDMFKRITFPETQARMAAPQMFVGPVTLTAMELKLNFAGKPLFVYQMFLPSGHKAVVNVEGSVGRVMKAEVE